MSEQSPIVIPATTSVTRLSPTTEAVAVVDPGKSVTFQTMDAPYRGVTGEAIDRGLVDFRDINLMTGPVAVNGAAPGDALGFTIDAIELSSPARVLFNARWRSRMFGIAHSVLNEYQISDQTIDLGDGVRIPIQPMIGCIATAPSRGLLSSLAPCRSTGGNLDIPEITTGSTVWLPVRVARGLFALGDLHGSMGYGEPVGCGLECAGSVTGRFRIAQDVGLEGVRIETPESIHFVGSHAEDHAIAAQRATLAAWRWLTVECKLSDETALALSAAMLDLTTGGPAGANMVASFNLERLRQCGIHTRLLTTLHGE